MSDIRRTTRARRVVARSIIAISFLAVSFGAAADTASAATATTFHAHIDAYPPHGTCHISEWSSSIASCNGRSTNSHGATFNGSVRIGWCTGSICASIYPGVAMPAGYTRLMKVCVPSGNDCGDYLIGAVVMPNGPFAVVAGVFNGQKVTPDDTNQGRVEQNGGPLFLYVGHHSSTTVKAGQPAYQNYVFGLRGWVRYG
jgi:hypothetical protein